MPFALGGPILGCRSDGPLGRVAGVNAPDGVLFQVTNLNRRGGNAKEVGSKVADVLLGYPGSPEVSVDVAGKNVFGLNEREGFCVSSVGSGLRPRRLCKLCPDVS